MDKIDQLRLVAEKSNSTLHRKYIIQNRWICDWNWLDYSNNNFNIDLLKTESINYNQEYYSLLCSYGFLPQFNLLEWLKINHLVDNIFTNNTSDEITSGNIYLTFSEHFSQLVSVKREKNYYKSPNVYIRDYSKFSTDSFRDDISIQNI